MKYRKVNDESMRAAILRDDARGREQDAFIAEIEVKRQGRLAKLPDSEHKMLAEAAAGKANALEREAASLRRLADARVKDAGLSEPEVIEVHINVLDGWVGALEREHVAKTTQLGLVEGRSKDAQTERAKLKDEILVIESAHAMAVEMLDDAEATLGEDFPEDPAEDKPREG